MTEQEKLDLLNRAIKSARNWGIGFGLMVVAALPVSALDIENMTQEEIAEKRERIIYSMCSNYADMAGHLLILRRGGMSMVRALGRFGYSSDSGTINADIQRIIVDVWSLPDVSIPRHVVEEAEYMHCLETTI